MKKGQGKFRVTHLIVAILAAVTLLQGTIRDYVVLSIFLIFAFYHVAVRYLPKWKQMRKARAAKKTTPQSSQPKPVQQTIPIDFQVIMMRHINFRITEKLHGAGYVDASWHWCCKAPLNIVLKCGTARIRTFGTGDKNYADVVFSPNGRFSIMLMQIEELETGGKPETAPKAKEGAADLASWYEVVASRKICAAIDEVAACGNRKLFINEAGEIYILQNGQKNVQFSIAPMPEKEKWKELLPLFKEDDISASISKDALALTWKA